MNASVIPRDLLGLEAVMDLTRLNNLPPGLRPCIAFIMAQGFGKDGVPSGEQAAFLDCGGAPAARGEG